MDDDVRASSADRYAVSQAHRWKAERDAAMQELRQLKEDVEGRLMPEGMEWLVEAWPRFEDGEAVRFGDMGLDVYGRARSVEGVKFTQGGFVFISDDMGSAWWANDCGPMDDPEIDPGKRVKRPAPKVLDADGAEIEVGDDLYSIEGMLKLHVSAIDTKNARIATEAMLALDKWADPAMYTHRAPVLAADGKPLREGETVWSVDSGTRYTVEKITDELIPIKCCSEMGSTVSLHPSQLTYERPVLDADGGPIKVGDTVLYRTGAARGVVESIDANSILPLVVYRGDNGELYRDAAKDVTHTKPEIDTWERIEEDARLEPPKYADRYRIGRIGFEAEDMRVDLVRRAKKLAEKEG